MTELRIPIALIAELGTDNAILMIILSNIVKTRKPSSNTYFPFNRQDDIQAIVPDWSHKRIRIAMRSLVDLEMVEYKKNGFGSGMSGFSISEDGAKLLQQNKKRKKEKNKRKIKIKNKKIKKEQKWLEEKRKKFNKKEKLEQIDNIPPVKMRTRHAGFFTDVPDTNTKNYSKANFETLWKEWPAKVKGSKADALKMFEKIAKKKDSPQFEDLMKAIKDQSKSEQWQAGFIPHLRTWLSKGRWIDEIEHLKTFHIDQDVSAHSNEFLEEATQAINNCIDKPIVDIPQCAGKLSNLMRTWQECQMAWRVVVDGTEVAQMKSLGLPKIQYKEYLRKCTYLPNHLEMMESYLKYLNEVEYISKIRPALFKTDNQILMNWFDEMQDDLGHDLLTGKTI